MAMAITRRDSVLRNAVLMAWSMYYSWRVRQYESLIRTLEVELAALRNMPFENPAPFEDLPEVPNPDAARILAAAERRQLGA